MCATLKNMGWPGYEATSAVVVGTKIASLNDLGTWAICKRTDPSELAKNWPRYA